MLFTGTPLRRATSECPSSCTSTEPKNSTAVAAAATQAAARLQPGYCCGKYPTASDHRARTKIRNQL